jgi:hypothetical protein
MKTHTTDCLGIFNVMASQVRPGSTKSETFPGLQQSDLFGQASSSIFHQGPRPSADHEAECMGAISSCGLEQKKVLGKLAASM